MSRKSDLGELLEALNRGNFFLIPLDNQRQWFRYHHLFAEVLRMHLMTEQSGQVAGLHLRASEWYEQNGSVGDAIRHALSGKDFARAARLIEMAIPELRRSRQESTMLGWLQALPDAVLWYRPVLSVHYAGSLLQSGKLEGVEARLRDAEQWLEPKADMGEIVVVDEEEFQGLAGSIAMYRAAIALTSGDLADTMKYARQVHDLVSEHDHLRRGASAGLLGLAYWRIGDLEAAHQSYVDCMARLQKIGYVSDAMGCAIALADIRIVQGRLHDALRTYKQALQMATDQGTPALRGMADMYVGMSEIERERNNLSAATQHLMTSNELGSFAGLPQNPYRRCLVMAHIRRARSSRRGRAAVFG
jgi:LuxR family maltose regulon positive regulatory protein